MIKAEIAASVNHKFHNVKNGDTPSHAAGTAWGYRNRLDGLCCSLMYMCCIINN